MACRVCKWRENRLLTDRIQILDWRHKIRAAAAEQPPCDTHAFRSCYAAKSSPLRRMLPLEKDNVERFVLQLFSEFD